jgi:hypothetical protein
VVNKVSDISKQGRPPVVASNQVSSSLHPKVTSTSSVMMGGNDSMHHGSRHYNSVLPEPQLVF